LTINDNRLPADEGMLFYLIQKIKPGIARHIKETGEIETIVIGLGKQGTHHAGLMRDFGTNITAGIAPGRGGTRILETIPVYDTVKECLKEHPYIAAASIWRHYSTAGEATIEAIESGLPIVVLITEGIPVRDIRDILAAARKHKSLFIGGNSPGVIFPPERVKIGMLPDVFYPEEKDSGQPGPSGVTIISRSGAILYHLSDALASAGIAQNAVLGIGGDAAIGSTFLDLVPLAMDYPHTDLVVIAGEIGGAQEERLAGDIKAHPGKYPKPIVALISGAHAPEGKRMGHAGAIVSPGQDYGTFQSKKTALEQAGIKVVNSQHDLIQAVKEKLPRTYFKTERYYQKMKEIWEAKPKAPGWGTLITRIEPNSIMISGYPLDRIVARKGLLETTHLLIKGEFPVPEVLTELKAAAFQGVMAPAADFSGPQGEELSKALARCFLLDEPLASFPAIGTMGQVSKACFALGRTARFLASIFGTSAALAGLTGDEDFSEVIHKVVSGKTGPGQGQARMLEAMVVASVDHGVTPPSAQATIIAASVRAAYEVALASGVSAITDVHGGAGGRAARFFSGCVSRSKSRRIGLKEATESLMSEYIRDGRRIEGLGHRIHAKDPRRDVLWKLADEAGIAGDNVAVSRLVSAVFREVRGMELPINVDGVIGAIVADMGLDASVAKALFIWGRIAGLSAHYFEEIASQPEMRTINFDQAVYKGKPFREVD